MAKHENFFETLKEAQMRLVGSVVLYDKEPYYVLLVSDHRKDGIFRAYLDKCDQEKLTMSRIKVPYHSPAEMDDWLEKNPNEGIIRKMCNSHLFNSFRPFPLGMVNKNGGVVYARRIPAKPNTQQGLTDNMLSRTPLSAEPNEIYKSGNSLTAHSQDLARTIKGDYPSIAECIKALNDPKIVNNGAAFHREFALIKGKVGVLYLAYKDEFIGYLPSGNTTQLILDKKFKHLKETVDELKIFYNIEYTK